MDAYRWLLVHGPTLWIALWVSLFLAVFLLSARLRRARLEALAKSRRSKMGPPCTSLSTLSEGANLTLAGSLRSADDSLGPQLIVDHTSMPILVVLTDGAVLIDSAAWVKVGSEILVAGLWSTGQRLFPDVAHSLRTGDPILVTGVARRVPDTHGDYRRVSGTWRILPTSDTRFVEIAFCGTPRVLGGWARNALAAVVASLLFASGSWIAAAAAIDEQGSVLAYCWAASVPMTRAKACRDVEVTAGLTCSSSLAP